MSTRGRGTGAWAVAWWWRRSTRLHGALLIAVLALLAGGVGAYYVVPQAHAGRPGMSGGVRHYSVVTPRGRYAAEARWFQQAHFGKGTPAPDARIKALRQAAAMPRNVGSSYPSGAWLPLGPAPLDTTGCLGMPNQCEPDGVITGRVTALAVNPNDIAEMWLGSGSGGLWHSTDGGGTWTPVFDNQPSLTIGAIALDASNPTTIYVGTGGGNGLQDDYGGAGIFKSTDDGAHWTQLGFNQFGSLGFTKLAVDPHNSQNVLAAVAYAYAFGSPPGGATFYNAGVWRSTNGGTSWSQVLYDAQNNSINPDIATDIVFDPAHQGVAFAGLATYYSGCSPTPCPSVAGVYKSTDGGGTWNPLTSVLPTGDNVGRISLGVANDGEHLYAAIASATFTQTFSDGDLYNNDVYVSADGGTTWTAKDVSGVQGMSNDDNQSLWWYASAAAADPNDNSGLTAYVGSTNLWKTTDGGTTWTDLTNANNVSGEGTFAHVFGQQHAIAFEPGIRWFLLGNDGGLWSMDEASGQFFNLNSGGLNISQFYAGGIGEVGFGSPVYGGTQGTGTVGAPAGPVGTGAAQWTQMYGGDAGPTAVDWSNNSTVYVEMGPAPRPGQIGPIYKSTDAGKTWSYVSSQVAPVDQSGEIGMLTPLVMSPGNSNELLTGLDAVWRTTDGASTWTRISPVLDSCGTSCGINMTALAVAPSNDNVIYAGDAGGNIYVTTDGGTTWNPASVSPSPFTQVTSLAVDPTNPQIVYVTFPYYEISSEFHLYKSTNGGASWTDISTSLPNAPFSSVAVDPADHNLVVVGTDVGVFYSPDAGTTWYPLGTGLPTVPVDQVFFSHSGAHLLAATHGRGMWELAYPHIAATVLSIGAGGGTTQTLRIQDLGAGTLTWSQTATLPPWLKLSATSGVVAANGTQYVTLTCRPPSAGGHGAFSAALVLTDAHADNAPFTVWVRCRT